MGTENSGDIAWMLVASALVLFMTPGLAFFYGGMVRAKNVLAMLMQNYIAMGIVTVLWAIVAYSLAFGNDAGGGLIGDLHNFGLSHMTAVAGFSGLTIPPLLFCVYQMMFAIITPALITGASADRLKFAAWVVFVSVWLIIVYAPIAHWVFSPTGWLFKLGALDFAGGTVVHINAGAAGLALALVLGKRKGWPREAMAPHALPWTLLGAGALWFGWFGFNAGSALGANDVAVHAFVNTQIATGAAMLGWLVAEKLKEGKATTLGAASGAVAGLVAITPCAGFVGGISGVVIGFVAGFVCLFAVSLKFKFGFDDALDVVGVHMVGGAIGALLLGLFADKAVNSAGANGLFLGGGLSLLGKQALAVIVTIAYSFVVSLILAKVLDKIMGLRVAPDEEQSGLDTALHAEVGYNYGGIGSMGRIG